ncbi:carbon storage regulator [Oribacterium sp. HCP28S3_H8]|jgi:carbon storage regulator|uniref:carbon storage regulator n=1 Tax=Oribacterium sp. HCP28S3_H8 TaxID=3438945 RepID=UPI003F89C00D
MLVLRRKKNDSILIGDNIRLTVVETAADGVRLAIDAPKSVSIIREELSYATKANEAASTPSSAALSNMIHKISHLEKKDN